MNTSTSPDNATYSPLTLTPHLVCADAVGAIDFYRRALGATELMRLMMPDGKTLMHASLKVGDSMLMLMEENPQWEMLGPLALKGSPVVIHMAVPDVDAAIKTATDAGATVTMPPTDMFWGERYGQIKDPFGHTWSMGTVIREMTMAEIQEAARNAPPCGG